MHNNEDKSSDDCKTEFPSCYLKIPWLNPNSDEYTKTIEVINDCYRKMLMIGKNKEVFCLPDNKVPDLLSAKTNREFILAKTILNDGIKDSCNQVLSS
jgi:hypothetical protein